MAESAFPPTISELRRAYETAAKSLNCEIQAILEHPAARRLLPKYLTDSAKPQALMALMFPASEAPPPALAVHCGSPERLAELGRDLRREPQLHALTRRVTRAYERTHQARIALFDYSSPPTTTLTEEQCAHRDRLLAIIDRLEYEMLGEGNPPVSFGQSTKTEERNHQRAQRPMYYPHPEIFEPKKHWPLQHAPWTERVVRAVEEEHFMTEKKR